MKNNILIICVNYNNESDTLDFITSILKQILSKSKKIQIIISDNSDKISVKLKKLQKKHKNIIYLKNNKNKGYFQGANSALKLYLKRNPFPEWIIISNPDIIIEDPKFVSKLLKIKEKTIIAPSIISAKTKRDQNPFLVSKPSIKKLRFYKIIYNSRTFTNIYNLFHILKSKLLNKEKEKKQIYAPHGSFIIINNSFFKNKGHLNYKSFLFGEEIFLAEEAKKAKIRIIYNPDLKVIHKQNSSVSKLKNKHQYLRESLLKNLYLQNERKPLGDL